MAVISIARAESGQLGVKTSQGIQTGSFDMNDIREISPVGRIVDGLSARFSDAVNDVRANAGDVTGVVAKATVKPQGFDA